jgi:integrase
LSTGCFASGGAFYNWFVECVEKAGIEPGLSPHGLRKATARRLAEAGCTPHQIASITGHQSLKEVERYTRAADQKRLAAAAVVRLGKRDKD